ncbi:NAD-dependent epimerase/dehydratase family protein [Chryseobacterium paludis]|uniref:NAD-dependent epimerase/dehydratase family protein n=1 Tax=Chryseobacterium paludis TaxID=2956784 RepID=UPI0021C1C926|nr:NAD(P)-dependent oxidoreductase [Chryseobacterium paludis]
MIIGNGLIASSLQNIDSDKILFFASGVSNSLETKKAEFEREFNLLSNALENYSEKKFIYFSTLSVQDQSKQDSFYVLHKLEMENYIKSKSDNYLILRIGNIVGKGGNPNTLFNFLKTKIKTNSKFILHRNARRLLLDIDDIANFLESTCKSVKNETINFAYPYYYDLREIIDAIQNRMDQKANYDEADEGDFYKVDFDKNTNSFFSGIEPTDYLKNLAEKYT